jgi:murein DD-endopeptidase MepM/ murein hydrolase activator NlpD
MPFAILAKRLHSLAADTRLGLRLVSRSWHRIDRTRRSRLELGAVLSLLPLSASIAALAAAPVAFDVDSVETQPVVEWVATPAIADQIADLLARDESYVREARVQRGETLAALLARLGIDDAAAAGFLRTDPTARARVKLAPGRFVQARVNAAGELNWLRVHSGGELERGLAAAQVVTVERTGDGFTVAETEVELESRVQLKQGEIRLSLFGAADEAGVPDSVAQQIIDALESEIDFHRDLRRGDSFRVIYEALYASGEYLRPGRLLAVEFVNGGRRVSAYWFADGSRHGSYYALDGRSMKRGFLRSPLEYTRVSSGFSGSRSHPVFGYDAAHRGVDYAAPTGTRIRSIGDGKVTFAGWQRGYGNVVEIQHDAKHSTLYAHLHAIAPAVKSDARVAQGDQIGTVGMTGWATGPHLHFELKIHGAQVNPMTAKLPAADPLAETQRPTFLQAAAPLRAQLTLLERVTVAAAERP